MMFGVMGMLKWCGTHRFLVLVCFIDMCFLAYDLGVRNQQMSAETLELLHETRLAQKETEDLVQENLLFFRKYVLDKHREKTRVKQLAVELEKIEAMLEDMRDSKSLQHVNHVADLTNSS